MMAKSATGWAVNRPPSWGHYDSPHDLSIGHPAEGLHCIAEGERLLHEGTEGAVGHPVHDYPVVLRTPRGLFDVEPSPEHTHHRVPLDQGQVQRDLRDITRREP